MRFSLFLSFFIALGVAIYVVTTDLPVDDPIWWFSHSTPPTVEVLGPSGPLRGSVEAAAHVQPADRASIVAATLDGRPVPVSGSTIAVDTTMLPDGHHRLEVLARDRSRLANEARAEWVFVSDNTGPDLDVALDPAESPREGATTLVKIRAAEPIARPHAEFEGRALRLHPDGDGGYWAVIGFPPEPEYRALTLTVRAADRLGNESVWEKRYPLVRTSYPTEDLDFDPNKDYLAETGIRAQENARLMPVYQGENGPPRWGAAPFLVPVEGPVTTDFGTRRSYNGRFPQGNHAGVDYAAPLGAPVIAPAAGVVVYQGHTPVRGNVLILDHGAGVYSTYAHLERFVAEPGAEVAAGDLIAQIGNTGLSTGPHLHWEVWVDGANVDPLQWTQRTFP